MENIKQIKGYIETIEGPILITYYFVEFWNEWQLFIDGSIYGRSPSEEVIKEDFFAIFSELYAIEFLNKDKGHQRDIVYFNTDKGAQNWAKTNLESFHPDMIKYNPSKN